MLLRLTKKGMASLRFVGIRAILKVIEANLGRFNLYSEEAIDKRKFIRSINGLIRWADLQSLVVAYLLSQRFHRCCLGST